ncbi:membrane-bound transcription factor site-2 protease [Toxorhynchites rutilus septentrionalis]|uniref:membrane-bound transcription factor site-2 protease n=1 Tax=Toxorhynchites rutilus septentrionalis TaxID=329112 RepID=UPI002479279F|nr:membrane-bound transcription factor site-2 protease [Toxorhynchites rutilus septentrionalis]
MDFLLLLGVVVVVYGVLLFFDSFFKSCMHYPYEAFLKSTGLSVKFLRLQWHTTALNRSIVKWSTAYPKLLDLNFSLGVYLSLVLMPLATCLIVVSAFHTKGTGRGAPEGATATSGTDSKQPVSIDLLIPGVNLPINEIGYYIAALAINSIVHEMGHGLAAVLEDVPIKGFGLHVMLIVPMAYTQLNSDQLNALRTWKRLKVLCAGIWHNLLLAAFAYLLFVTTPVMLSAIYRVNESVMVTDIKNNSPLLGAKGLEEGDIITSINDCEIRNEPSWFGCLLETLQSQPSYCISPEFVHLNDESVPISHRNDGLIECCSVENKASNCFEYMVDVNEEDVALPQHMCLNIRKVIENSFGYCHLKPICTEGHCFKPMINNFTTIMQIRRERKPDVIYIGHPGDLTRTIRISQFVPKTSFFRPGFADAIQLLLKYVTVFAVGLAVINVIPCFGFDGQHIVNTLLANGFVISRVPLKSKRDVIALCINIIGTLFVFILLAKVFWQMVFKAIWE